MRLDYVIETVCTTTKVRLQFLRRLIKGLENSNKLSLLPRLKLLNYFTRALINILGRSKLKYSFLLYFTLEEVN